MLTGIIICKDQQLSHKLATVLATTDKISIVRTLSEYPKPTDLIRTLRSETPDVIFLSCDVLDRVRDILKTLEREGKGIPVIAVNHQFDAGLLRELMRAGVRECLSEPFERHSLVESLLHLQAQLKTTPAPQETKIFSFLPSKAGVGASTVALNVSAALSRLPDTRVLLSDFDLSSGLLDFMLKLRNENSVMDALERVDDLDPDLWSRLVSTVDKLDVLHARTVRLDASIQPSELRKLMISGRELYHAMCFDLSGNMEAFSTEILQQSTRIVLVCTPEASSLHLARKKLVMLRGLKLAERVAVVVNRSTKADVLNQNDIQQLLGVPVMKMVPNNYLEVNRAIEAGKCVALDSALGRVFNKLAGDLAERQVQQSSDPKKWGIMDLFSVTKPASAPTK